MEQAVNLESFEIKTRTSPRSASRNQCALSNNFKIIKVFLCAELTPIHFKIVATSVHNTIRIDFRDVALLHFN